MHNSSYSRAKFGLEAREYKHKPKGKSCGYYMRIVFFFSSLIQSLIIVSLVLFLIYGQPEKSAEEKMVEELELNFNRISDNNVQLRKEKGELGAQLGARTAEKAALETELAKLRTSYNLSENALKDMKASRRILPAAPVQRTTNQCPSCPISINIADHKRLQNTYEQLREDLKNTNRNFSQTMQSLNKERDAAVRDADTQRHEATRLRGESSKLQEQLTTYTKKCKEDFAQSLDGIETVTSEFLKKIENFFPHQLTFHLTCESQNAEMEKIKNSCTNLSKDVEKRFQLYLNAVGDRVAAIQSESSELQVRSSHCQRDHSRAVEKLREMQTTHDAKVEKLLKEQMELRETLQRMALSRHNVQGK
ncbi:plasmalemma vesicle associated protein b [Pungitius pungitius]|uniref:plasmalemma vesicle associated protein b n=1 Tax=Pungitius pungitius TaxID=134920 RepID=UPI002E15C77B